MPIFIILIAIYHALGKRDVHPHRVFEVYLKISYFVALFGLVQWVLSYFFGINILIKESGALDSITYEPSHYATVIMPAAIYRLLYFRENRLESFVILLSLLLTFSLTAYVVIVLVIMLPRLRLRMIPVILLVLFLVNALLPILNDRLTYRIEGLETVLRDTSGERPYDLHGTNASIISLYTNMDVAFFSLIESPLIGSGLGGHETMYYRYFDGKQFEGHRWFGINYNSAHSLLLRIISETGLVGVVSFFVFLYRNYVPISFSRHNIHHVVSLSCIGHFVCKCFKLGGYFDYGTPVFLIMLILNLNSYYMYER